MITKAFDLDRIGGWRALDDLVAEILGAGAEALQIFRRGVRADTKPDRSPVTDADRAAEARLRAFCAKRFPACDFLGEEEGAGAPQGASMRFVVDPIDGTRAFLRGLPTWSVLVGLEADDLPSVGIAYFPATEDLYVGVRGGGARGNGRPLRVSAVDSLEASLVCHGALQQFAASEDEAWLTKLARSTDAQRGFADFDGYRQVLLGRADAMIDPSVRAWDLCAAAVLVREAGGRFTDFRGEETIHGGSAIASNGLVHDALLALAR